MKIIAKEIEVIAKFNEKGMPTPIKFKINNNDDSSSIVKIDKVLYKENEKLAGNHIIVFRCQAIVNGILKIFEIKYELGTCRWILFKI